MPIKKVCKITDQKFVLLDEEMAFCDEQRYPYPEICPEERLRQLTATRNEWRLYHRKCDMTGEHILSAYNEDAPFPVYKNEIWWGDSWEALDYGQNFDFDKSFFEQFAQLQKVVPREGTSVFNSENCKYNSHTRQSKNCYLCTLMVKAEDCYYCNWVVVGEDIVDCLMTNGSKICYDCVDLENCYSCFHCQELSNSSECYFSYQLRNCQNCLFCTNLNNKEYYLFNEKVSPEEFAAAKKKFINGSYLSWQENIKQFSEIKSEAVQRYVHSINGENTSGDHLHHSKNCYNCFDGDHNEDCYNCLSLADSKNVYSCYSTGWTGCENCYMSAVLRGCTDVAFSTYCWFSNSLRYCDSCISCQDCFGCIGLRHKQYCIFNKQYSKEEYFELKENIVNQMKDIGEYGKFFPAEIFPFAYNETSAQEHFPLSKDEALKLGYKWSDYEPSPPQVDKIIPADKLPDNIQDIPNDILNWAIVCKQSQKPFQIIEQEFKFYQKHNLPIPRLHPECRHQLRFGMRNEKKLYSRNCDKCQKEIQSSYSQERPEIIYCEDCYLAEAY